MDEIKPRGAAYKETANLSFAAFAYMKGMRIIRASERRGRGNVEYSFGFDDAEDHWDAILFEFANSEASRFDNAVRTLKQLCKRNGHG